VGPQPSLPIGLSDDVAVFRELSDELWQADGGKPAIASTPAREALQRLGVEPDFSAASSEDQLELDYIHRRTADAEIYFVANRLNRWQDADCSFRVAARQPELWDPLSGQRRDAGAFYQGGGRTVVPLRFPPHGSMFVVFCRAISPTARGTAPHNDSRPAVVHDLNGPWTVQFDPRWGGTKEPIVFGQLVSWTERPESEIRYYSGTAVYRKAFDLPAAGQSGGDEPRWWLDLGEAKNVAAVRINGSDVGIAWTEPFRVELTGHLKATDNQLEIEVTNLWPNRLIGDSRLPPEERITGTNITKFQEDSPLRESGLLGPVRLLTEKAGSQ
jgi:hypothetical protein